MGYPHFSQDCIEHHDLVIDWGRTPDFMPRGIITLCGATRFAYEFRSENRRLSLQGFIVISLGLFGHSGDLASAQCEIGHPVKDMLDALHKRKIDLANRVHVIDPGGYIGDSTRSEIAYAEKHGKVITYLSQGDG